MPKSKHRNFITIFYKRTYDFETAFPKIFTCPSQSESSQQAMVFFIQLLNSVYINWKSKQMTSNQVHRSNLPKMYYLSWYSALHNNHTPNLCKKLWHRICDDLMLWNISTHNLVLCIFLMHTLKLDNWIIWSSYF